MIPNVVRGGRMAGLMVYLAGPGKRNEHEEPHLVGGDPAMMAWHDDSVLDRDGALSIARHLERPRRAFGVDVMQGVYERQIVGRGPDGERRFESVRVGQRPGHVWHCSLSLRAEEGMLRDDQWAAIATDFVSELGFDDHEGTKAPCRWVAVRHGVSENGNDHVHIVVNLVREDGTKASVHNDRYRAQSAARNLEQRYGLEQLESVAAERASRGWHPAEREAEARRRARGKYERDGRGGLAWERLSGAERQRRIVEQMRADQPRWELARRVRAVSTASATEDEFVRRGRRAGLLMRPRYMSGRDDVIVGYSVAARPAHGERPVWYGGGHLARDLTLPRLRERWPDTPATALAAADEWRAAKRGRRVVRPGREAQEPAPQLWEEYTREVERLRESLRTVPVDDRARWASVARDTAGAFAAWSTRVEPTPGPLAATADALARSAETKRRPVRAQTAQMPSAGGAALLLMSAAQGGRGTLAEAVLLRQLANLAKAIHDMHVAADERRRAAEIARAVRTELVHVAERLPATETITQETGDRPGAEAQRVAQQGPRPDRELLGSPIPAPLEPERKRTSAGQQRRERTEERDGR